MFEDYFKLLKDCEAKGNYVPIPHIGTLYFLPEKALFITDAEFEALQSLGSEDIDEIVANEKRNKWLNIFKYAFTGSTGMEACEERDRLLNIAENVLLFKRELFPKSEDDQKCDSIWLNHVLSAITAHQVTYTGSISQDYNIETNLLSSEFFRALIPVANNINHWLGTTRSRDHPERLPSFGHHTTAEKITVTGETALFLKLTAVDEAVISKVESYSNRSWIAFCMWIKDLKEIQSKMQIKSSETSEKFLSIPAKDEAANLFSKLNHVIEIAHREKEFIIEPNLIQQLARFFTDLEKSASVKQACRSTNCLICPILKEIPDSVSLPSHYNSIFNCRCSFAIYYIQCRICGTMIHIGRTKQTLRDRLMRHVNNKNSPLRRHFEKSHVDQGIWEVNGDRQQLSCHVGVLWIGSIQDFEDGDEDFSSMTKWSKERTLEVTRNWNQFVLVT